MFRPVPAEAEFLALEKNALTRWARHRIFERSLDEREGAPDYVFYEGPPTANGRPSLHHVWARIYKDLFCRFHTMRGRRVLRRAGWDTHGLPVEVEVEKALGFTGKKQIDEFGIYEFNARCRDSVHAYVRDWARLTERIGFWVNTDDAYWTLTKDYVESVWWHLKAIWDQGLLYEDVKVVPYCPRCGTALSSHELGQPDVYLDVEDPSAYVRFPLIDSDDALLVWTTTPWTLVSNTGVAVNPELTYAVVGGLFVAEDLVPAVFGEDAEVERRVAGGDLVGRRYERPFDLVSAPEDADGWRVVPGDFVTTDEGTGLVHLAPAFGEVDRIAGRETGLPLVNPVDSDGRFTEEAGWLAGKAVKETDTPILDDLRRRGLLFRAEPFVHSYPHCWRCSTPLIYWGKQSWYIATSTRKEKLLAANETVEWRPEHTKHGRFGEWLSNNVDWALSRDRYWGTPLPVWRCALGHARCVGSLSELSELVGHDVTSVDPHRPEIDVVTYPCPDCGGEARRVEPVIDAWFDSGAMPAAQWGFPHVDGSEERFRYPADFICEAVDQTRGWFYSLLAVNVLVFDQAPYRSVLSLGHIVDADGRKMSKSFGNDIEPWEILDTRGADPLRWWMFHQGSPWTSTRTSLDWIDASTRDVLVTLWNTWGFFSTYARLNGFDPTDSAIPSPRERTVLDRWARSRLHSTIAEVTSSMDDYQPLQATTALARLVDDLSNWYVRRSRRRFWRTDPAAEPKDALAAQATLHEALVALALLIAPFCPFLADEMWRHLTDAPDDRSVHLAKWPTVDDEALDAALEREMAMARRLVSLGRAARAEAGVRVRQPLRKAIVLLAADSPSVLADIVGDELNVDHVEVAASLTDVLAFELVPNWKVLGPRLGPAVKELRAALGALDAPRAAADLEEGRPVVVRLSSGPVELTSLDIEVRARGQEGFAVSREGSEAVALDLALDLDLRRRGLQRDVVRSVQELRRARGFEIPDRITLHLDGLDELAPMAADIAREVLAVSITFAAGIGDGSPLSLEDAPLARAWIVKAP